MEDDGFTTDKAPLDRRGLILQLQGQVQATSLYMLR